MDKTKTLGICKQIIGWGCLTTSFYVLDAWLRVSTRWIGAYSIYELAPNLFSFMWSIGLSVLIMAVPSRKVGRIIYGLVYAVCLVYAVVQYGAWLILGRFLYASDFLFAGEGADYTSWVLGFLTFKLIAQILLLVAVGVVGVLLFPKVWSRKSAGIACVATAIVSVAGILLLPNLYGSAGGTGQWDDFANPAFEYRQFTNANYDLELTGMYQFFARDLYVQSSRGQNKEESAALADAFFGGRATAPENEMTGLFANKNLIVVMLESIDDWLITEADMPTLYSMMSNGINFSNFYTPQYSNGYTFNTEFAFHTSTYPFSNGNVAYSLLRNDYRHSIANRFSNSGYSVNSYHVGLPSFYNRGEMHRVWGYEQYYCWQDYKYDELDPLDDRYLVKCDALYEDLVKDSPFYSFVITCSGHVPYTDDDEVNKTALALYPQYDVAENREVNILRAKARLTDDMFAGLLERLAEDSLLEDTVIVCYTDHYAYGITDEQALLNLSTAAGSNILEKTPAFIYCAGMDLEMTVDKVAQITDLAPTIMNLFGLEVPKKIMGRDIFDDTYEGHVIFPNGSWLTEQAYVRDRVIQWNNGMTDEDIAAMNAYVQQAYQVNDAILNSDYYAHKD